jgi:argininosuccinate synthase
MVRIPRGEGHSMEFWGKKTSGPVAIIRRLAEIGNAFGIDRHCHVGTSVLGKKGRRAYEFPAAVRLTSL